jgi:hypothetical protein
MILSHALTIQLNLPNCTSIITVVVPVIYRHVCYIVGYLMALLEWRLYSVGW